MTIELLLLFLLLSLAAEILGTIGGFGSSLFFVPIAGFFFDFHIVLGITALFHVSSNVTKIYFFRKGFDRKLLISIGIPSVIFVIVGAWLSKHMETRLLEILLSVFLIILSLLFLLFKKLKINPTNTNAVLGGTGSGFIAGLLGTGGAIRGMTLASFRLNTEIFIATSAIIDLAIDISRSVVYTANGYLSKDILYLIPMLLVVSVIGTYIGKIILKKISEEQFRNIVLILILITGLISISKIVFE